MKSPSYLLLFSLLLLMSTNSEAKSNTDELKPRIVIMSDIGDCNVEPDDMESAIRLFSYADQFEIEAFMTTVGWNCDPYPQEWGKVLEQVIDASMSKDAEGDHLSFYWWYQPEAGTSPTKLVITDNTASRLKFRVPLIAKGGKIHLIREVHDDGPFHLVSYQRVILEVR